MDIPSSLPRPTIRRLESRDVEAWAALRAALWPTCDVAVSRAEVQQYLDAEHAIAFVAESPTPGQPLVGFIEVELRDRAEGCRSHPVPYVEGWYVAPPARRQGVGRALMRAAETWATARGFTELASDCITSNRTSAAAHRALGFSEVQRAIHFRKPLNRPA